MRSLSIFCIIFFIYHNIIVLSAWRLSAWHGIEQSYVMRQGGLQATVPVEHTAVGTDTTPRTPVGDPIPHKSSSLQVTGEALYVNDVTVPIDTLHGALVLSTHAHAIIIEVDTTACTLCPGFVRYVSHLDIRGSNSMGPIHHDEEVFASREVHHHGAIIGLVVAESHEQARYAASKVVVTYEVLPAVISIAEAIKASSFFIDTFTGRPWAPLQVISGDVDEQRANADVIVSGEVNVAGQEHFYLETNCCLVIPSEFDQLEIISSTQNLR